MTLSLAAIIVNYRTPDLAIDCIRSLLPELQDISARIVVVDNLSGDGSAQRIRTWLDERALSDKVMLLESPGNLGFSGGNNLGIKAVSADHYLLINSDTLVKPDAIRILLETSRKFPGAGIVSPRLVSLSGETQMSCFRFQRPLSELADAAQTSIVDRLMGSHVARIPIPEGAMEPEWTSFACALVRKAVFDKIGLLDDKFFMYFEDMEFCHRTRKAGWTIVHNPAAEIIHFHGGSSAFEEQVRARKRLPRYYYEARTRYFYILYGWRGLLAANIGCILGLSIAHFRKWMQGMTIRSPEYRALDIWLNFFRPERKSSMLP
ncbi:MAG TPA: glycosyltransferase family 2 protein [Burkholderiales bacterium]|nr:glycosyltransferase family 2 protein [Burkholderiales bacterium]